MPELPEVETIRRQLEPELQERRIERLEVLDARWTRPIEPRLVEDEVRGRTIGSLRRRGKYLLLELDGDLTLVMHLRMTGNLLLVDGGGLVAVVDEDGFRAAEDPYLRARFLLDDGRELRFSDARRFGEAFVLPTDRVEERFAGRVGIEPLSDEFTADAIERIAAGRRAPLKSFLLDQGGIAGVGNIYADEALWWARIHPLRPAASLEHAELRALVRGVRKSLTHGIARQGATLRDYRGADGRRGSMQREFRVYGRLGEPCTRCGTPIEKTRAGGRGSWYCPNCQV